MLRLNGKLSETSNIFQLYTPTITGVTTNPTLATAKSLLGRYRVSGKTLHIAFSYYAAVSTGAANGSGAYKFSLPDGYTIDTSVATIVTSPLCAANNMCGFVDSIFGTGFAGNASSVTSCFIVGSSSTTVSMVGTQTSNSSDINTLIGSAAFQIVNGGCFYKFTAEIPIV